MIYYIYFAKPHNGPLTKGTRRWAIEGILTDRFGSHAHYDDTDMYRIWGYDLYQDKIDL